MTKDIYSATGEKLRVVYQTAVPNITVAIGSTRELMPSEILYTDSTDYLLGGALMLKNGKIDKFLFDEGYCQATQYNATQDNFTFLYYDKDHLGNVRQVTKAMGSMGTVMQTMNYYPFALRRLFLAMAESKQVSLCSYGLSKKLGAQFCDGSAATSDVQPYKYNFSVKREERKHVFSSEREKNRPKVNGKELDKMHGLNTYDYGARQYNPVTARWDRMDPLAEKYYSISPYVYCLGNPVKYVDIDGKDNYILYNDGTLMLIKSTEASYHTIYSANNNKSINVGKSFINSEKHIMVNGKSSESKGKKISTYNVSLYSSSNIKEVKDFCLFASNNTNVEWSFINVESTFGDNYGMISTSHSEGDDASPLHILSTLNELYEKPTEFIHSHNYLNDFVSEGDVNVASQFQDSNPYVKLFIYDHTKFIPYDKYSQIGIQEVVVKGKLKNKHKK